MPTDDPQAAKLHYIDKVHAAHFEAGRSVNRVFFLQVVLSFVVIFLTTGAVSVDHRLSFAGVSVSVPVPLLLLGMACAIALLQFYDSTLSSDTTHRRKEILRLYESLGFVPENDPLEANSSRFDYPDVSTVAMAALRRAVLAPWVLSPVLSALPRLVKTKQHAKGLLVRLAVSLLALLVLLLVILFYLLVAEVFAVRYVIVHQGMSWLTFFALLFLGVLNAATWLTAGQGLQDNALRGVQEALRAVQPVLESAMLDPQAPTAEHDSDATSGDNPAGAAPA